MDRRSALIPRPVVPDAVSPLVGYREWDVVEHLGDLQLKSVFHSTLWPPDRPLEAQCLDLPSEGWLLRARVWHPVPTQACRCGIYAHGNAQFEPAAGGREGLVAGVVLGWGRYVLGSLGWRCETARAVALVRPEAPYLAARVEAVAARYGVPVLDRLTEATLRVA